MSDVFASPIRCYHSRQHPIKYGCYQLDSNLLTTDEPTVNDLGQEIHKLLGIPVNEQALCYDGRRLDLSFDKRLMDLRIPNGAEIIIRRKVLYEPVCVSDKLFLKD